MASFFDGVFTVCAVVGLIMLAGAIALGPIWIPCLTLNLLLRK